MPTKPRKVPLRKCVVTQERLPKKNLLRVVVNKEGEVFFDLTGKANGRGAYVKNSEEVILKAKQKDLLGRHLEVSVPVQVYEELYQYAQDHI